MYKFCHWGNIQFRWSCTRESSFRALNELEQRQESNSRKRSCQVNRCLYETSAKMWLPCRLLFPKQVYNEAVGVSNEICVYLLPLEGKCSVEGEKESINGGKTHHSAFCLSHHASLGWWTNGPVSLGAPWCFRRSDLVWTHPYDTNVLSFFVQSDAQSPHPTVQLVDSRWKIADTRKVPVSVKVAGAEEQELKKG